MMKRKIGNAFFCALFLVCTSISNVQPSDIETDPAWDLLIFTQSWPATVCIEWKEHDKSHSCNMPANLDSWTIHGIWPTKLGTMGPAFCNRTWHFDPEKIRPIEETLLQLWTNIELGTSTYALWAHEWDKHGTCAASLEPLNSELKYFSMGLDWIRKFMMHDILAASGIIPSSTNRYRVLDLHTAIKSKLGVNPAIECRREKKEDKTYLAEIRICFTKSLELHDCDGILNLKGTKVEEVSVLTNCPTTHSIIYLDSSSNILNWYKFTLWLQWLT